MKSKALINQHRQPLFSRSDANNVLCQLCQEAKARQKRNTDLTEEGHSSTDEDVKEENGSESSSNQDFNLKVSQ